MIMQLIDQEPGTYMANATQTGQDKMHLAWERFSHETKESGSRLSSFETIYAHQFKLLRKNGCTHCFLFLIRIMFKPPVALIYHLFHIYFRLKYNLLHSHPSSTLHGSAVYGIITCLSC
jgi:hypothetical protein